MIKIKDKSKFLKLPLFIFIFFLFIFSYFNQNNNVSAEGEQKQRIVYVNDTNPNTEQSNVDLFIIDKDGSNKKNLSNTLDRDEVYPDWSPTGQNILFMSVLKESNTTVFDFMVIDSEGLNQVNVSSDAPSGFMPTRAYWSDDGNFIYYFAINEHVEINHYQYDGHPHTPEQGETKLMRYELATGITDELYSISPESSDSYVYIASLSVGPKSGDIYILYNTINWDSDQTDNLNISRIIKLSKSGGLIETIVEENNGVRKFAIPMLSPDERWLAFITEDIDANTSGGSGSKIELINLETSQINDIAIDAAYWEQNNIWTADSKKILFWSDLETEDDFQNSALSTYDIQTNDFSKIIDGNIFWPYASFIDSDTKVMHHKISQESGWNVAITDLNSGQIALVTQGGYPDIYPLSSPSSSTNEPSFVDPSTIKPPKTGSTLWVGVSLFITLGIMVLIGHMFIRYYSKRINSLSEK